MEHTLEGSNWLQLGKALALLLNILLGCYWLPGAKASLFNCSIRNAEKSIEVLPQVYQYYKECSSLMLQAIKLECLALVSQGQHSVMFKV